MFGTGVQQAWSKRIKKIDSRLHSVVYHQSEALISARELCGHQCGWLVFKTDETETIDIEEEEENQNAKFAKDSH